ncbi:hypothetical protein PEBR_01036 [Penicillium brasilianum]|uniref:Uncharacterized protein n=1 Tax=Penicillium brasilianum TaxID=104259 RepID=A0A1S9S008_PENBI|nr:hypothetical protein PEBR_01036 [Penicillium brasilianum]
MHTLPPAPGSWAGAETMQRWLQAKIEEDRRCQEEEKTRQETMKLERRKVDHAILVDALRAGVPPHLAPLVLGGVDGPVDGKLATPEMLQYMPDTSRQSTIPTHQPHAQPGAQQPATLPSLSQQFSTPPAGDLRDMRTAPSNVYASTAQHQSPAIRNSSSQQPTGGRAPYISTVISSNNTPAGNLPRPMEMNGQSRSTAGSHTVHSLGAPRPPSNPPHRGQHEPRPRRASPSIAFHHWIPPSQLQSQALSNRIQEDHVLPSNGSSAQVRSEIQGSPGRKRKSLSVHHQLPPPPSRSSGAPEPSSRHGRHSPAGSQSGQTSPQGDSRRHSDVSSSRDTPAAEKDQPDYLRGAEPTRTHSNSLNTTENGSHGHRRRSTGENATFEDDHRGPDREHRRQSSYRGPVPDTKDNPDPAPNARNGTGSSTMTDWGDRE